MRFTFPKYTTTSNQFKTCVTKVSVTIDLNQEFSFDVHLVPLKLEDKSEEVKLALKNSLKIRKSTNATEDYDKYFLHFSNEQLVNVGRELSNDTNLTVTQIPTPHSVLFENDDYVWKLVPNQSTR